MLLLTGMYCTVTGAYIQTNQDFPLLSGFVGRRYVIGVGEASRTGLESQQLQCFSVGNNQTANNAFRKMNISDYIWINLFRLDEYFVSFDFRMS